MCVARHAQFAIARQFREKLVSDKVDFLPADKAEIVLQSDTMIFDGNGPAFTKFPK